MAITEAELRGPNDADADDADVDVCVYPRKLDQLVLNLIHTYLMSVNNSLSWKRRLYCHLTSPAGAAYTASSFVFE